MRSKYDPEPTTKKLDDAIKWSKSASRATDRPFSAGGFVKPDPASYLMVECPDCAATVQVMDEGRIKNSECPYCQTKLWVRSTKSLVAGVKKIDG